MSVPDLAAEKIANEDMRECGLLEADTARADGRYAHERRLRAALAARAEGDSPAFLYAVITQVHLERGAKIVNDELSVIRWRERPDQNACDACGAAVGAACLNGGRALPLRP